MGMESKMIKTIIALMMAMVMVLAMAACGQKQEEAPAEEPEQQEEQQEEPASTGPELTDDQIESLLWQISDQDVELRYQEYMPDEGFAEAEIFGIDREGDEGTAYVNLFEGEYVVVDDKAYNVSASSGEAIIKFEYTDDQPKYKETIWSADGGDHDDWMKENFPPEYLKKSQDFLAQNDEGKSVLGMRNDEAASKELGVPVDDENILEIDDEKKTYQILKTIETGDPADGTYQFDTEVIKEGKLEDLKQEQ